MDETINGIPIPFYFQATVKGEPYGFDLRDCAVTYAYRKQHGVEPVFINPVTLKEFHRKTRRRMIDQLEALISIALLPRELSVAWR